MDEFERAVVSLLVAGQPRLAPEFGAQCAVATVRWRERAADGFVAHLGVPADVPRVVPGDVDVGDEVRLAGRGEPVYVTLAVRGGLVARLEARAYTDAEPWPEYPVLLGATEDPAA